jgi:uncharacterized UBP type Zn finger protein
MMAKKCTHLDQIRNVTPGADGCEECLAMGDTWVHLRICMTCGHVGCCDVSKNKHATKHFHETGHPIIKSFQPGEDWGWCYIDEMYLDSLDGVEVQNEQRDSGNTPRNRNRH